MALGIPSTSSSKNHGKYKGKFAHVNIIEGSKKEVLIFIAS